LFRFYLRFENRWIGYGHDILEVAKVEGQPEYEIPAPEFAASDSIQIVTRDIQDDLTKFWHSDGFNPEVLDGFRFRGEFRLLFLRIV
jgi:hypothetical protein